MLQDGASALHLAAMNGHRAIVEILIKSNLNKELKDLEVKFCYEAQIHCRASCFLSTLSLLLQTGETALHKSAFHGQSEVLQLLLQKGADKEARSKVYLRTVHWYKRFHSGSYI